MRIERLFAVNKTKVSAIILEKCPPSIRRRDVDVYDVHIEKEYSDL